nr:MAG TPA: hypothetical protein [Caudoviricetes sp.]
MNKIPQYNNIRYISITSPQCSSLARVCTRYYLWKRLL